MIGGSCLCGTVRFEFERAEAPFVYCHCNRCRKFTGSAFFAALRATGLEFLSGQAHVRSIEAPILTAPPAYRKDFCERCGSPVPWPDGEPGVYAVPAGCLDDDPEIRPERHVWVNCQAPWHEIHDELPRFTDAQYVFHWVQEWDRAGKPDAADGYAYVIKHYPDSDVAKAAKQRLAEIRGADT